MSHHSHVLLTQLLPNDWACDAAHSGIPFINLHLHSCLMSLASNLKTHLLSPDCSFSHSKATCLNSPINLISVRPSPPENLLSSELTKDYRSRAHSMMATTLSSGTSAWWHLSCLPKVMLTDVEPLEVGHAHPVKPFDALCRYIETTTTRDAGSGFPRCKAICMAGCKCSAFGSSTLSLWSRYLFVSPPTSFSHLDERQLT